MGSEMCIRDSLTCSLVFFYLGKVIVYFWLGWLTCGQGLVYFWLGCLTFSLWLFLKKNVARVLYTFGLGGLHLARALCACGSFVLHLAWSFLKKIRPGYCLLLAWLATFGQGLVYF